MGNVLQIRVSAGTYEPDDVHRHWPRLSKLAWSKLAWGERAFAASKAKGVRELTATLNDLWKFGNEWRATNRDAVGQALPGLLKLDSQLEAALADRRPDVADALSYQIEDALDALEREME